eukprot:jgi/Chrzof1/8568/Cz03g15280.t1
MNRKPLATEESLLQRRVAHGRWISGLFDNPESIAYQTVAAYSELLDEALLDVAVDVHREYKTGMLSVDDSDSSAATTPPVPLDPLPGMIQLCLQE